MKAIMISIKPEWCAKIMNGYKTVEVRKNKALASAIQKLIDENGYADIYVYCSKDGYNHLHEYYDHSTDETLGHSTPYYETNDVKNWKIEPEPLNGKVVLKFRCYKVEEIKYCVLTRTIDYGVSVIKQIFATKTLSQEELEKASCLTWDDLMKYLNASDGYAIHISDLEIFNNPREIYEFHKTIKEEPPEEVICPECGKPMNYYRWIYFTKAPQNFCYLEVGE